MAAPDDLDPVPAAAVATELLTPFTDDLDARLDTVVVNTTVREHTDLLELLASWAGPTGAPLAAGDRPFRLVVLLNQDPGPQHRAELEQAVMEGPLAACVERVEVVSLELDPELDRYVRDGRGEPGEYGLKSGPNVQFFRGLDRLEGSDGYALVVECDTRPVRPGWFTAARELVAAQADAWVLGAVYRGPERVLTPSIRVHLNGNAIYSLGREFGAFRRDCWEPLLRSLVRTRPAVAYDFALTLAMTTAEGGEWAPRIAEVWHRLRATAYLQNLTVWHRYDPRAVDWDAVLAEVHRTSPGTYLVHGVRTPADATPTPPPTPPNKDA